MSLGRLLHLEVLPSVPSSEYWGVNPRIGGKVPQNGWFISWKTPNKMDDLGVFPIIFGNTHIHLIWKVRFGCRLRSFKGGERWCFFGDGLAFPFDVEAMTPQASLRWTSQLFGKQSFTFLRKFSRIFLGRWFSTLFSGAKSFPTFLVPISGVLQLQPTFSANGIPSGSLSGWAMAKKETWDIGRSAILGALSGGRSGKSCCNFVGWLPTWRHAKDGWNATLIFLLVENGGFF